MRALLLGAALLGGCAHHDNAPTSATSFGTGYTGLAIISGGAAVEGGASLVQGAAQGRLDKVVAPSVPFPGCIEFGQPGTGLHVMYGERCKYD